MKRSLEHQRRFVEEFASSDLDLLTRLRGLAHPPQDPILHAIIALRESLIQDQAAREAALAQAEKASLEPADPEFLIHFYTIWANASYRARRMEEAWALVHRAKELVGPRTAPETRAELLGTEAYLAGATGNKVRRAEILDEALRLLPPSSPRRSRWIWNRAMFLARQGRGVEAEEDLKTLRAQGFAESRIAMVQFVNAVETGRLAEADALLSSLVGFVDEGAASFRLRRRILDVLLDRFDPPASPDPPAPGQMNPDAWAMPLHLLLRRRKDDALRWARPAFAGDNPPGERTIAFTSWNLVRAELACGNGGAARRLLDRRLAAGDAHFLNDLFLARAFALEGNRDAAVRRFGAAARAAERLRAEGRLDLECRMACELPPGELLRFYRAAADRPGARAAVEPPPPPPTDPRRGIDRVIGRSAAMAAIRASVARFAPLEVPVLVTGETGTGKELVARALHESGPRSGQPFLAVNCGAIADTLLETELFGHERGAFTGAERARRGLFEEAGTGTLFLDEIGDISPRLQVLLLRVIETGEILPVGSAKSRRISCRIIAATNAALDARAEKGAFRRDLLFRLRRLEITIPPLRERREDILPLASFFLDQGRKEGARAAMSGELREALTAYSWPGNVREVRNEIERMRLLNSDGLAYGLVDLDARVQEAFRRGPGAGNGRAAEEGAPDAERLLLDNRSPHRRRDRLRGLFRKYRTLSRNEIAKILAISLPTATEDLKALIQEGAITRVEPTASRRTHYFEVRDAPAARNPSPIP